MTPIRRHPALLLLAAIVAPSVLFVACGGDTDGSSFGELRRGPCVPRTVRSCLGPRQCAGEQSCLANGKAYSACKCTAPPGLISDDAATSSGDASTDGPTSNDASDGPSSNDASTDGPSSNDASDGPSSNDASDGPTSNDASDDGPSSNDAMGNGPTPNAVQNGQTPNPAIDDAPGNYPILKR